MPQSRMLELAHEKLYWPKPSQIWEPSGSGPKVYAQLASEKIGEKIKREFREEASGLTVSVLAANPEGDETEAPIAIVCQFTRPVPPAVIKEVHRLAWSFSRARSLITIEPQLLRVWSCCEPPQEKEEPKTVFEVTETDLDQQAADALQWVELVSGQFFQERENRFKRSGAADQMLLKNLKDVRQQLKNDGLDDETIHDLLARIIFIQFLFQKQDSDGTPALKIQNLHRQALLSKEYKDLPEILENFDDTYSLFRWLNNKFNGDLFPGKGQTEEEREAEWQTEIRKVRTENNRYLVKLAQFARGDLDMQSGQLSLWPYYSFDVIPLEFISSVYEEFVNKKAGKGVHYTPEYIVDFILDGVLPWNDKEWDLKVLDPACGSGIFLVKAFQRLIYRWEAAHDAQRIPAHVLRTLLENNIFGVDIDKEAVRVASFSLYLTMLDSIDPLEYWKNAFLFPRLRSQRLIHSDFFAENKIGFRSNLDSNTYDLIVGNAPWGKNSITDKAKSWQKRKENKDKWKTSYGNIGPLFLPKAAILTKPNGQISMMQPVLAMLFYQNANARRFRQGLLSEFKVEEVVNLSSLRFGLFKTAISPACIITFCKAPSNGDAFAYICPKPIRTNEGDYRLIIEPCDVNFIYPEEALNYPLIWATFMWGGSRDFMLMRQLCQLQNVAKLTKKGEAFYSQGINRGNRKEFNNNLLKRKLFEEEDFPSEAFLYIDIDPISENQDPYAQRSSKDNPHAFDYPQLIIKQSWQIEQQRFRSVLTASKIGSHEGILCSGSYVSVHIPEENISLLEAACLSYNSKIAAYYLLLSSGSFASYIPKVNVGDLMQVPIPSISTEVIGRIKTYEDIDLHLYNALAIRDSDRILIEDLFNFTLPDFKGDSSSPGRQKTHRTAIDLFENQEELELTQYCEYFMRVIRAGFGQDKEICATIFHEPTQHDLPVRLVAIYLNRSIHDGIKVKTINSQELLDLLNRLNSQFIEQRDSGTGGIFYQRVARIYASTPFEGEQVPTVYLIKPDKIRYWTRSMALRDADEVSADIMAKPSFPSTH